MYWKKYREKSRQLKKKLEMKNCNMTLIEQQQRYLLSSGKINKYDFLTDEEILPPQQHRIIEQAKCTYSPKKCN